MGDLELAVRDRDNQTNLWDFAGFPIGLATDDSTSSIDLRPGTHSLSSVRDLNGGVQRQNLAARGSWAQSEAVYRNRETGATFGVVGSSTLVSPELKAATLRFVAELEKAKGDLVVDLNVRAHLWADPAVTRNCHTIEVDSDSARFTLAIENIPSENPKTGKNVALSVIAALRKMHAPLAVGT